LALAISLADLQKQAGANFAGGATPADYGNPHGEYAIAASEAAVIDFSDRCQIELTGGDRVKFLQNFCTNDLLALALGAGCEAFLTSLQGKVLAHLFIFVGAESLVIESVAGTEEVIVKHLDKYLIAEDVEIHPRSEQWGELFLTGPDVPAKLTGLGLDSESMVEFDHRAAQLGGVDVWIRRVDWLASPGFLVAVPRGDLAAIWSRLTEAQFRPVGDSAFHSLRIETVTPWDRLDITDENLAQEVDRTDRTVSFSKGCYLGQEPIARIDAIGHVNRELRGVRLSAGPVPPLGAPILNSASGKEIGKVTSAAMSYSNDVPVVLGYLRRNYLEAGTRVVVDVDGTMIDGTVFTQD